MLFLLFFVSGFCGLVYQLVWTRMAFASFGIITPVLSVVISVFMLGLSAGSWAGGKWIVPLSRKTGYSPAIFYALAELCIGLGAFLVPKLFGLGERLLESSGETNSATYLAGSAVVLALSILPWCLFMGTTFPFMMAYMRDTEREKTESFSFLYLANVLGATFGILSAALVLVEIFGFKDTLRLAAAGNFVIAVISFRLGWDRRGVTSEQSAPVQNSPRSEPTCARFAYSLLFATGFISMSMEVVWTRAFAPILKTQVYSFAAVVAVYLSATFVGSWLYRSALARGNTWSVPNVLLWLCVGAFFPVLASEGCFQLGKFGIAIDSLPAVLMLLASIVPFCGILGYLTPQLVDHVGAGSPRRAGSAYAVNVVGCILGPLFASYLLLPYANERHSLVVLGMPLFGFYAAASTQLAPRRRWGMAVPAVAVFATALLFCRSFEEYVFGSRKTEQAHRDYAASVICVGTGMDKWLLVNGNSMTSLTPITKFMAHLPLAFHQGRPESALVICFGMGTTYRSCLSWDVRTTAVELVPSVVKVFGFFFPDAAAHLQNPKGRVVIDDGRRFLKRTDEKYDVIIIDPPPPVEAAGSSLLYSKEFYDAATRQLKPGGILQAWVPDNFAVASAALRSLCDSYPHVRCFGSIEGQGVHMLASMDPIPQYTAAQLVSRMPDRARADLLEWASPSSGGAPDATSYVGAVLRNEIALEKLLPPTSQIRITDDQPYNEYFLLRKYGLW